jgi:AhpD family alkylhydroperoxidase
VLNNTVRHVGVVSGKAADGVIQAVYRQARDEIGMLPDAVTMFSSAPDLLVATWAPFRETLLATGTTPRVVKEAVAARVSVLNKCPFCVDAHTIMLYGSGAGDFATSLLSGQPQLAGDPRLLAVSDWVTSTMARPAEPLPAPFGAEEIPEMVGTLVEFQFLNRVINVLLDGTFLPGPDQAKRIARKVSGKVMARRIRTERTPGAAIELDTAAPLPADFGWAAPRPTIAAAFAGLAAAAEAAAERVVPPSVVALLDRTLGGWNGRFPGPSRTWVTGPLASLPFTDQPAGRLALLTAMAPFQVTAEDIAAFRAEHPEDEDVVAMLTWAAFTAARRIGAWSVPTAQRDSPAA